MTQLDFPVFANPYLGKLSVCAHVFSEEESVYKKIANLPKIGKPWIAKFGSSKQSTYVTLFGGGPGNDESSKTHLHVNLFRVNKFNKKPSFPLTTTDKISRKILEFTGKKAVAGISSTFYIPVDKLPTGRGVIAPALARAVNLDQMTLTQTAGKLSIKGGPVESMEWQLRKDGKEISVEIDVFKGFTFGSDFLSEFIELSKATFELLVLGERANVESANQSI